MRITRDNGYYFIETKYVQNETQTEPNPLFDLKLLTTRELRRKGHIRQKKGFCRYRAQMTEIL